ncbi:alpha/beta hydrolase [Fontivita pretiosa]|uniref:alpha/beta hydrolase n=1 Tax=Fontivita pretiosa TaxID=2989684 RepID=UPI003D16DD2F
MPIQILIRPLHRVPRLLRRGSSDSSDFAQVGLWFGANTALVADTVSLYLRSWQGFRGTFGLFSWPTQATDNPVADPGNFNRSEEIAWHSGAGLRQFLNSKQALRQSGGKLTVFGHSMGGVVVSEALALAGQFSHSNLEISSYWAKLVEKAGLK